jgi:hypothetical protein
MPAAMQEIEQNAGEAALMGNLIVPMLVWLVALLLAIIFTVTSAPVSAAFEAALFAVVFVAFPIVVRAIGRQWIVASRKYVKIVIVAFVIACRVAPLPAAAAG